MSHIDTLCINITMFYIFNIMHCYDRLMYLLLLQFVCNIYMNLAFYWLEFILILVIELVL